MKLSLEEVLGLLKDAINTGNEHVVWSISTNRAAYDGSIIRRISIRRDFSIHAGLIPHTNQGHAMCYHVFIGGVPLFLREGHRVFFTNYWDAWAYKKQHDAVGAIIDAHV